MKGEPAGYRRVEDSEATPSGVKRTIAHSPFTKKRLPSRSNAGPSASRS